jgi:hypothetical protein
VTLPSSAVLAGLHTSGSGSVSFALQCPAVVDGNCEASGTLSITLPSSSASSADAMAAAQRTTTTVLARLTGVQISSGEQQFVAVKLSRSAITYLRAHGIYRARATLSLTTTLQSGAVIRSSQHVWLYVSALTGCQSATGTLSPGRVGSLKLGMTRAQAHRTGRYTHAAHGLERYCIAHGKTRVAYATKALTHHARTGRAMLILTANHRYTIHGITVRMSVKAARHQGLRLSRPITVGKNAWYLIRSKHATWVLKVQDGTIREIGITTRALTHTPTQQRTLLHQL